MPTEEYTYYHMNTASSTYSTGQGRRQFREHLTADDMREKWGVTRREEAACEAAAVHVGDEGPSALETLCRHLYDRGLEELDREQARRTDKLIYLAYRLAD